MTDHRTTPTQDVSTAVPDGTMNLGDVLIWPASDDGGKYYFLPVSPSIAHNRDGSEQVSLIDTGSIAFLQIATQFTVPDARLEAIRADIEIQTGTAAILSFAPIDDLSVWLLIGDGTAMFTPSSPSEMPPYNALFNVQLEGETKNVVLAGLAGQTGRIAVRYQASLIYPRTLRVTLSGRLDENTEASARVLRDEISEARVRIAISKGWAKFDDPDAVHMWPDTIDVMIGQAVDLLKSIDFTDGTGDFSVDLMKSGTTKRPLTFEVDFGKIRTAPSSFNAILPSALFVPEN